jgi:hypothetical protein
MKIVRIRLGLGNQMFQYAVYRTLQNKGEDVYLDISDYETHYVHYGYELSRHFNINERIAPPENVKIFRKFITHPSIIQRIKIKLKKYYDQMLFFLKKNKKLNYPWIIKIKGCQYYQCYWVAEKYFSSVEKILRHEYIFKNELDNRSQNILAEMGKVNSVSIHIRRGTFINHPIYGDICTSEYYQKAIDIINRKVKDAVFYIFSEDLGWVKANLSLSNATFVDWNTDENSYRDMQLMAGCKHNIIANSSFSWWAAWLNDKPDKIVIAPNRLFKVQNNTGIGLIPKSWITVKV